MPTMPRISRGSTNIGCMTPILYYDSGWSDFLEGRSDSRASDESFSPARQVRQTVVDSCAVTLAPRIERNKSDVCQRVVSGEKLPTCHFAVEGLKMLLHLFFCLFRLFIVSEDRTSVV